MVYMQGPTRFHLRICLLILGVAWVGETDAAMLKMGTAHVDITPDVTAEHPVWLAGYLPGRQATAVHDPLYARCMVLDDGGSKFALVAVDLIGLQYPNIQQIRSRLPDFSYVAVASTHNHEGPDVIGIWGPSVTQRGVDDAYVQSVIDRVVQSVRDAERAAQPAKAFFGKAEDAKLLADTRWPVVKDGVLRVLRFTDSTERKNLGVLIQWNCHPEALGANNTQITADFPASTISLVQQGLQCPVVYLSGAIGGLITPPRDAVHGETGETVPRGTFEYAHGYGAAVANLALRAARGARPIQLTPMRYAAKSVGIPVTNRLYRLGRLMGILQRDGYLWYGRDKPLGEKVTRNTRFSPSAIKTEVACVQLGQLRIAMIPGELYPELVRGEVIDPPIEGMDYPEAPVEPSIANLLAGSEWMLFGLANDEIGYIIPKRQWDRRAPYVNGRTTSQYGEINSCGPDTAGIVMDALKECVAQVASDHRSPSAGKMP